MRHPAPKLTMLTKEKVHPIFTPLTFSDLVGSFTTRGPQNYGVNAPTKV